MKVTVIDAHSRALFPAIQLKMKGFDVRYWDASDILGPWALEDQEGPFPVFQLEGLSSLQRQCLFDFDPFEEAPLGLVMRLGSLHIETRGPLRSHNWPTQDQAREYFLSQDRPSRVQLMRSLFQDRRSELIFSLAHGLSSTRFLSLGDGIEALQSSPASFLTAPLFLRRTSRPGLKRSLERLKQMGIEVRTLVNRGEVQFGELDSGSTFSGLRADELQWLVGEPSRREENLSTWQWSRFRVQFHDHKLLRTIPDHCVFISKVNSSWSGVNFMICVSTPSIEDWDFWVRFPSVRRFDKAYLHELSFELTERLVASLPFTKPKCVLMPPEFKHREDEISPSPFSLFDAQAGGLAQKNSSQPQITYLWGPTIGSYDRSFVMQEQRRILNRLQTKELIDDQTILSP